MRDRYTERVTVRMSKVMIAELDSFVLNHSNTSKNSIIRQSIQSWLNSTPTAPKPIVKPEPTPTVKDDDPFSDSIYNW